MSNVFSVTPAVPIPAHLAGEVKSKLAYVDESLAGARIEPDGTIVLQLREPADEARRAALEEKVQRVVKAIAGGAIRPKVVVLEDKLDRPVPCAVEPDAELSARGEIFSEAPGILGVGPLVARLIDYFERRLLEQADAVGAAPYRFPMLIPAGFLERVGYFTAFPHSLSFVAHLREDLDAIEAFSRQARCDAQGLRVPAESLGRIQAMLSPAVCYHLYFLLADKALPGDRLVATAVGHCFRYESTNMVSLERLWDFTMREIIFVGAKDFVLEARETMRGRMAGVLEELGLAYRVESANDPFFIGEFRRQTAFQSAFQLKFEVRARLPFKDGSLAVGSYNYHQDFFGRTLRIRLADGSPVHTGCVAFGLERMAYAFLAQFGIDPRLWPAAVRNALPGERRPEGAPT
jgi:hypothetical protein